MKRTVTIVIFFNSMMFSCFGMNREAGELEQKSQEFYQACRNQNREAQQLDQQMDSVLNTMTFGLYNRWRGNQSNNNSSAVESTSPDEENSQPTQTTPRRRNNQSRSPSSSRPTFDQTPEEQENEQNLEELLLRGEKLEQIIEKSGDLEASSKEFLFSAKKKKPFYESFVFRMFLNENARTIYGLIPSVLILYVGIRSLNKPQENRTFGYSATMFGTAGTLSMLYNLIK